MLTGRIGHDRLVPKSPILSLPNWKGVLSMLLFPLNTSAKQHSNQKTHEVSGGHSSTLLPDNTALQK